MAIYTAIPGGGNWNVAATWGGAGVPTTGDTAILNATSGQVTVTANALCLILDCTGYANTLTINTGFILQVSGTGATISLGGTISTLQQGELSTRALVPLTQSTTINFNGVTIPRLLIGYAAGAGNQTVTINGTNPTVQNLRVVNGSAAGSAILAGTTLNITNSLFLASGAAGTGNGSIAGIPFNITGGGTVDVTCSVASASEINSGFTVITGTTLRMLSALEIGAGVVTFQPGSFLSNAGNFQLSLTAAITATLDTSVVTWYNVVHSSTNVVLTSDLNISNNLTISAGSACSLTGSGGTRNINIQGGFSMTTAIVVNMTSTVVNLTGTGIWDSNGSEIRNTTVNINGTGPYTIGSPTRNSLTLSNTNVNLGLTSSATVNTNFNLSILNTTSIINTNNTSLGGSQVLWWNLSMGSNTTVTLSQETTFQGNLTFTSTGTTAIQGAKLILYGNLTHSSSGQSMTGTSTIEFAGSNNVFWGTTAFTSGFGNNITINKSGGTVTLRGTINWGITGRTLLLSSGSSTINPGTSTVTISINQNVTITNMIFNNLTITGGNIITQNALNTINSTLLLSGNVTFAGTAGWTAFSFTHGGGGTSCTLKAGITYTVQGGVFTMIGTAAVRATLQSDDVVAVTASIPANTNQMSLTATVPNPIGYVLGSTAFSIALPPALSNIIPDRPTIVSGPVVLTYTLALSIGPTALVSYSGQLGKKAFFNVIGTTNVLYAQTRDIDSNGGITIFAGQSFPDNTATPNLFRTLNWAPLVAPSGSVYYTFVS
jgi:hypothetical protein